MNIRTVCFLIAVAIFLVVLATISLKYYLRARKSSQETWNRLLERLTFVDRDNIRLIALDIIDESGRPLTGEENFALQPAQIWTLIGGLEGLEVLERNCKVLVDLAFHMQKWYPEALVVAEQLRLNAREIEWHVARLRGAAQTRNLESSFSAYAQSAIATYYLMTRSLLALYQEGNLPGLTDLQRAL